MGRKRKLFFIYSGYAFYDFEHFLDYIEREKIAFSDEKITPDKPRQVGFTKAEVENAYNKRLKAINVRNKIQWSKLSQADRNILANLKLGTHFGKGIAQRRRQPINVEDPIIARLFLSGDMSLTTHRDYVSDVDKNFILIIYDLEKMKYYINTMIQNNNEKYNRKGWITALEFCSKDYKAFGRKRVCKLVDITKTLANQMPKSVE